MLIHPPNLGADTVLPVHAPKDVIKLRRLPADSVYLHGKGIYPLIPKIVHVSAFLVAHFTTFSKYLVKN